MARLDYLVREQTAQSQAHELEAQRNHAAQLEATVRQQQADLAGTTAEFLRDERLELTRTAMTTPPAARRLKPQVLP